MIEGIKKQNNYFFLNKYIYYIIEFSKVEKFLYFFLLLNIR